MLSPKTNSDHRIQNAPVVRESDVIALLAKARRLENCRHIKEGFECLSPIWSGSAARPNVSGYSPSVAGEILLRCGALWSYFTSYKQMVEEQETARGWLQESLDLFTAAGITDKVAESETELAMTYWREDRGDQALRLLEKASRKVTNELLDINIKNISYQILVHFMLNTATNLQRGAAIIKEKDICVELCLDSWVKVHYYNNSALLMTRIGLPQQALNRHQKAILFCKEVNNIFSLAIAENNVSFIYSHYLKDFNKALRHCRAALKIFRQLGSTAREGEIYDTIAQIYLEREIHRNSGDYSEALLAINKSLEILMPLGYLQGVSSVITPTDDTSGLICALQTKCRIFLYHGNIVEAITTFTELYRIAAQQDPARAAVQAEAFAAQLHFNKATDYDTATQHFERHLLSSTLIECQSSVAAAAARLCISEKKLYGLLNGRHSDIRDQFGIEQIRSENRRSPIGYKAVEPKVEIKSAQSLAESELSSYECNKYPAFIPSTVNVQIFMPIKEPRLASCGLLEGRVAVVSLFLPEENLPTVYREFISAKYHYGYREDACGLIGLNSDDLDSHQPRVFTAAEVELIGSIVGYLEFDFLAKCYAYTALVAPAAN